MLISLPVAVWPPLGRASVTVCAVARAVTLKLVLPAAGLPVTLAVTESFDDFAVIAPQALDWVRASAAVFSAAILLLTDWYAEMVLCSVVTLFLRLVCGCASICIS